MIAKLLKRLLSSQNTIAISILLLILVFTYSIPLIINRSQNPIYQRSGLSEIVSPGHVSGQYTIDPNDGFTSQALGHQAAVSWFSGKVPYWNYYEGIGEPLAGGMQSAALFPLTLIQHFSYGLVLFHFLLALVSGIATYLFLRKLKLNFWIAVVGGLLFELNGTFVWLTNAAFNPVAFLPLLLLGIEYAVSSAKDSKPRGWILIALALSLSIYAGFPETALIDAAFAYGWAVVRIIYLDKEVRRSSLIKIGLGTLTGLLLAAPVLAAFLGFLPYATTGGHGGGGYSHIGLSSSTLPALFMPYFFGPIFGYVNSGKPTNLFLFWSNVGGYITIPIVLVAIFGLFSKRRLGLKLYLSFVSIILILRIYNFRPVSWLINLIPGTNQIAVYRYAVPVLSLALIILVMFGLEAIIKKQISRTRFIVSTVVVTIFVGFLSLFSRSLLHQLTAYPQHRWWAALSICLALSILLFIILSFMKTKLRLVGVSLILVVNSFILFAVPYLSLPKMSGLDYSAVNYLKQNLGLNRFYTLGPIEPNYGSYFNIASININDLPVSKNWSNYIFKNLDNNSLPIVFTGTTRANPNGPSVLEELSQNLSQYELVGVKYLVTSHGQLSADYANNLGLTLSYSDYLIDIYKLTSTSPFYSDISGNCTFTNQQLSSVIVNCTSPSTVIRRELYMPGWTVTSNGNNKSLKPNNVIFQRVNVGTGESALQFSYNPPHIILAYVAFVLGFLAIIASLLIPKIHNKTKSHLKLKRLK